MMMTWSKFMMVSVFTLALVFATRWCVLMLYTQTCVPTDARSLNAASQFGYPTKPPSKDDEPPASTLAPEYQAIQVSRAR